MPHHPAHNQAPPRASAPAAPRALAPIAAGATIVFLGDSLTAASPGYVDVLGQALAHTRPDLGLHLARVAAASATLGDLESWLAVRVLPLRPAWAVLGTGLDDFYRAETGAPGGLAPAAFAATLGGLAARLQTAGVTPILLTIPVLGNADDEFPIPYPTAYNRAIRELAAGADRPLVDLYAAFTDVYGRAANYKQTLNLTLDGIHPNHQGHALIARTLLEGLGLLRK